MNKTYTIYEFAIQDKNHYPTGCNVCVAYEKDEKAIKEDGMDNKIYHYVWEEEVNLDNISIGDTIFLDEECKVVGGANAKERKV